MADGTDRRAFARASWANVLGNAAKIVAEGAAGLAFGSVALLSDAAHSVADLIASIVVLVWGDSAFVGPDETHPHGHERVEPLTALFVGAVIVVLGLSLLYESVTGLVYGVEVAFSYLLFVALVFSVVDMYLVYRYTALVNADLGSTALTALEKDCLNDIYTSVAVIVGVIGVFLGVPLLDPLAGGFVSLLVVYQGVEIGRENIAYLAGEAPPSERHEEITATLREHPAVKGIHDLTIFYNGTVLEVETHVEVDGGLTLLEAHDIETELIKRVRSLEGVGDAHIHLDPSGIGEWEEATEP